MIGEETGVMNVADPLGGSWYVEALTDKIEAEAEKIFAQIMRMGGGDEKQHEIGPMTSGILRGIEDGWFTGEIADSAFTYQVAMEKGDKRIVGVNTNTDTITGDLEILRVSHEVERDQVQVLADRKKSRDEPAVRAALAEMVRVSHTDGNLLPPMAAVRLEATVGEICGALKDQWGAYVEPARF
ncbi:methylmalonyl-CoA mutase family protein [Fodinicola feengrottensis]|uniref:methylmalonyl-CoA mutase family protein n=1 Tax=Fodinicola feengrottensis TaxID=435914 RepID=UPI002441B0F9|nr:methylmalonyl-CoA mutase family protein [Fodinicola feengrottensis]